ncbi:hypothetical protein Misp06_02879 [Microbulbifer sp. NBRC 101763]|uniref:hypothetical protein n=1 Tax=Microbulbifer TaxID=48073 RepID=UPI00035CE753|nr:MULTISPECIES: hypothetical protein [Microbulbifer]WHI53122.1 hypothetical protein P3339_10320 [Microbulbifer sp. MLAF003]
MMGVGGISLWQLIIIFVILLGPLLIFGSVAKKAGFSRWWGLLLIVPVVNIVLVWVLAFVKWPVEEAS